MQVTDEAMLAFLLRRVRESVVFLVSSERLQRRLLRAALGVFGEGSASPRLQALLLLRALALHLPQPMPSNVLKVCHMLLACTSTVRANAQVSCPCEFVCKAQSLQPRTDPLQMTRDVQPCNIALDEWKQTTLSKSLPALEQLPTPHVIVLHTHHHNKFARLHLPARGGTP